MAQLIDNNAAFDPRLRTRGSWVQVLPGAPDFKGLGSENQVLLATVGPLWDLLSTGPHDTITIQALGVKNQVLLPLPWDSVGLFIHTSALASRNA